MAKKTFTVPKSATDTIVTVDIPDPVIRQGVIKFAPGDNGAALTNPDITWTQGDPVITQTPVAVEPPPVVVDPPTAGRVLTRLMDWKSSFPRSTTDINKAIIPAAIGAGYYNTQSVRADSISQAAFPGTGEPAMKMSWKWPDNTASSYRAEIQSTVNDANEGDDFYYGFSFYPETWAKSATWGQSILQWHDTNGTNPPVGLQINGDNIEMTITNATGTYRFPIYKFVVGKRVDFVIHVKWTKGTGGIVEVWVNGLPAMTPFKGATLPASGPAYSKIGLNYWGATASSTPRVAYYGPFRVGKTYKDVAP